MPVSHQAGLGRSAYGTQRDRHRCVRVSGPVPEYFHLCVCIVNYTYVCDYLLLSTVYFFRWFECVKWRNIYLSVWDCKMRLYETIKRSDGFTVRVLSFM